MESFNGRFKDEGRPQLLQAQTPSQLIRVVDERMWYSDHERRHFFWGGITDDVYRQQSAELADREVEPARG